MKGRAVTLMRLALAFGILCVLFTAATTVSLTLTVLSSRFASRSLSISAAMVPRP